MKICASLVKRIKMGKDDVIEVKPQGNVLVEDPCPGPTAAAQAPELKDFSSSLLCPSLLWEPE